MLTRGSTIDVIDEEKARSRRRWFEGRLASSFQLSLTYPLPPTCSPPTPVNCFRGNMAPTPVRAEGPPGKSSTCCRVTCIILLLSVLIVAGGIVLWQYLPEKHRTSLVTPLVDLREPDFVFSKCDDNKENCCNGLETICDLKADEIMYAGLHNANAAFENGFLVAPNHYLSLEKALVAGYRAINIDLGKCSGQLRLIHGRCQLGQRDPVEVLGNIGTFLDKNPTEIVILNIQLVLDSTTPEDRMITPEEIAALYSSVPGFARRLYDHPSVSTPWPTLRSLRDNWKQILLFYYNAPDICYLSGCPTGLHDWFVYARETEFSFASVQEVRNTDRSCLVTRGRDEATMLAVNLFVTLPNKAASTELNSIQFLQQHISTCSELNNGRPVNVVWVDFWNRGDLPLFVQRQNDARGRAISSPPSRFRALLRYIGL